MTLLGSLNAGTLSRFSPVLGTDSGSLPWRRGSPSSQNHPASTGVLSPLGWVVPRWTEQSFHLLRRSSLLHLLSKPTSTALWKTLLSLSLFLFNIYLFLTVLGLSCRCKGFSPGVAYRLSFPMACGILAPLPGIKPVSPVLEGRFLTTGPPGKS